MSKYTIGEIAKACNVTVRTVQYYHEREILIPSCFSEGGRRLYAEEDLKRLKLICLLRTIGLSIDDISSILKDNSINGDIAILLKEHAYLLKNEIFERKQKLNTIEYLVSELNHPSEDSASTLNDIANNMQNHQTRPKRILINGGTVFVSKYTATYFVNKGYDVYVINRGNHEQVDGVKFIKSDRHLLNGILKNIHFDAVLDTCSYEEMDVKDILRELESYDDYILISSSAVYPETLPQPYVESQPIGPNKIWGNYGLGKVAAEKYLLAHNPNAYILRPPYLYGPMNNVYRESFVFDCAEAGRTFYVPKDGSMPLQFFHVEDLCKLMETILQTHPKQHIFNVGNEEVIDINTFVEICYDVAGADLKKAYVTNHTGSQRDYFSFYDYDYTLDITEMKKLLPRQKDLREGFRESYEWYKVNRSQVNKRDYIGFIDKQFAKE